jgi:hypothetical protein
VLQYLLVLVWSCRSPLLPGAGFESSSNFVESQQPGVFRKTLRNMHAHLTSKQIQALSAMR